MSTCKRCGAPLAQGICSNFDCNMGYRCFVQGCKSSEAGLLYGPNGESLHKRSLFHGLRYCPDHAKARGYCPGCGWQMADGYCKNLQCDNCHPRLKALPQIAKGLASELGGTLDLNGDILGTVYGPRVHWFDLYLWLSNAVDELPHLRFDQPVIIWLDTIDPFIIRQWGRKVYNRAHLAVDKNNHLTVTYAKE